LVVYTTDSTPSTASAVAHVTSSDISSPLSGRSERMKTRWMRYAPRITIAPWATLITRMIPNTRVTPLAIRAYTPPIRTPKMTA
jgi:hypothetical protein